MRKIISSIDIGSNSIKMVVGEFINHKLYILSAVKLKCDGIEDGKVVNNEELVKQIKKAVELTSKSLGTTIEKVILGVDMRKAKLMQSAEAIKIYSEDHIITGKDVTDVIHKCSSNKISNDYVLIGVIPIAFNIDNDIVLTDPKGKVSTNLGLRSVVVSSPKSYVSCLLNACTESGLKVVDVVPNALGDYYMFKNDNTEDTTGTIVNLGNSISTVSIFNKGVLTNSKTYPVGAENIVNDIMFIYKTDIGTARAVYKDLVLASSKLASTSEYRTITNLDGEEIKINQYDVCKLADSRINEILNLIKKQINNLTKKEISYIIVTGGLTELKDFNFALERTFGNRGSIGKVNLIGVRSNAYCSAVGILKYFDYKLALRGKSFSIFSGGELEEMNNEVSRTSTNSNSLVNKVFGYFFDS